MLSGFEAFSISLIVKVGAHTDRDVASLMNSSLGNRAVAEVTVGAWSYGLLIMNFVWDSLFRLNQA